MVVRLYPDEPNHTQEIIRSPISGGKTPVPVVWQNISLQYEQVLSGPPCNVGGVHLGDQAPLQLAAGPSLPLSPDWQFLPGKTACSFLWNFCEKNSCNKTATHFFHKMIGTYDCFDNPIMAGQPHIIPRFQPKFSEDSPALLQGFQKLVFSHGLDYTYSCSSLPNQVSCWHFLSSLHRLPDGLLSPKGLSATQLAQVLMNY